ncbi:MAG TPA: cupin domain-containing protein [Kofleriaceae bacterium]|nr:cupin domain-containing protein [Kofleriaceae bacterium]
MKSILGALTPARFLKLHWQKRPLLVRGALPQYRGIVRRDEFLALAGREDVTSRLVIEHPKRQGAGRWERHDGPLRGLSTRSLPASGWTLLVHGIESLVPGGWELLRAFSFLPAARIDDLMVSYATPGGSVGPHDDRYDVFLLQGPGRRRWQIQRGGKRTFEPGAAIKVLANFKPEDEWVLEAGDMLYLPPGVAHWGVAVDECFTYSIGFLAPTHEELVQSFLGFLGEKLPFDAEGIYADPELLPAREPLAIPDAMIERTTPVLQAALGGVRWDRGWVDEFIGRLLTAPRRTRFEPPRRPLDRKDFGRRLRVPGRVELALPSRGLLRGRQLFFNGEAHRASPAWQRWFSRLVLERGVTTPARLEAGLADLLFDWYLAGWILVSGS